MQQLLQLELRGIALLKRGEPGKTPDHGQAGYFFYGQRTDADRARAIQKHGSHDQPSPQAKKSGEEAGEYPDAQDEDGHVYTLISLGRYIRWRGT